MRKLHRIFIILFTLHLVSYGCKEEEKEDPTCEIVNPADGAEITREDEVTISVNIEDPDGIVAEISFYIGGYYAGEAAEAPYDYLWNTAEYELGDYTILARAEDDEGLLSQDEINVRLDEPGGFNPDLAYGTMTDYEGNSYKTILIGQQTWMAENLKVTHYADGTAIPFVTGDSEWSLLGYSDQAYTWYDNLASNGDTTGALYTWGAAMDGASGNDSNPGEIQGVCPDGWHLPGDSEWIELEIYLGMNQEEADHLDWRGTDEGGKLKEKGLSHWSIPNTGADNSIGFTALAGGYRGTSGNFYNKHDVAIYWTATEESGTNYASYRVLAYNYMEIYRRDNHKGHGYSIRCVQDP